MSRRVKDLRGKKQIVKPSGVDQLDFSDQVTVVASSITSKKSSLRAILAMMIFVCFMAVASFLCVYYLGTVPSFVAAIAFFLGLLYNLLRNYLEYSLLATSVEYGTPKDVEARALVAQELLEVLSVNDGRLATARARIQSLYEKDNRLSALMKMLGASNFGQAEATAKDYGPKALLLTQLLTALGSPKESEAVIVANQLREGARHERDRKILALSGELTVAKGKCEKLEAQVTDAAQKLLKFEAAKSLHESEIKTLESALAQKDSQMQLTLQSMRRERDEFTASNRHLDNFVKELTEIATARQSKLEASEQIQSELRAENKRLTEVAQFDWSRLNSYLAVISKTLALDPQKFLALGPLEWRYSALRVRALIAEFTSRIKVAAELQHEGRFSELAELFSKLCARDEIHRLCARVQRYDIQVWVAENRPVPL